MWSEIHSLNEKEQAILDMWSRGVPVRDIANELKMSKSSVDREVKRIIQVLQEKCRGF
jgi:DNA-binding NarL/FixJ family response regulator